eukprot:2248830-Pyramimonas_sp.AAC.1
MQGPELFARASKLPRDVARACISFRARDGHRFMLGRGPKRGRHLSGLRRACRGPSRSTLI